MLDNVVAGDKWEFNESVTKCFDNMLERSIPMYSNMRDSVVSMIDNYTHLFKYNKTKLSLLDIGCSNGLMIEHILNKKSDNYELLKVLGIDVSEPMLIDAEQRFKAFDNVSCEFCDMRTDFPNNTRWDIVTSILTIQFTPIEYRKHILHNIYDSMASNGMFICVEKVLGSTDLNNRLFVDTYYDMKRANGYTQAQIDNKRVSLEGVLVPLESDFNKQMFKEAGFKSVETFWRWMNFEGYIAFK